MSFLNTLKSLASKASSDVADQFNRIKNTDIMNAVVAACTYVAYADGNVSQEEKSKMIGFLKNTDTLKMYSTDSVIEAFGKFSRKFEFDREIGKSEVFVAVGKIKKNDEAQLVIRACVIIANSDGNFDQSEKNAVRSLCQHLNLDPAQFI